MGWDEQRTELDSASALAKGRLSPGPRLNARLVRRGLDVRRSLCPGQYPLLNRDGPKHCLGGRRHSELHGPWAKAGDGVAQGGQCCDGQHKGGFAHRFGAMDDPMLGGLVQ